MAKSINGKIKDTYQKIMAKPNLKDKIIMIISFILTAIFVGVIAYYAYQSLKPYLAILMSITVVLWTCGKLDFSALLKMKKRLTVFAADLIKKWCVMVFLPLCGHFSLDSSSCNEANTMAYCQYYLQHKSGNIPVYVFRVAKVANAPVNTSSTLESFRRIVQSEFNKKIGTNQLMGFPTLRNNLGVAPVFVLNFNDFGNYYEVGIVVVENDNVALYCMQYLAAMQSFMNNQNSLQSTGNAANIPIRLMTVLDYDMQLHGVRQYVNWEPDKHPHKLVVGATGSGKSYFLRGLMYLIAQSSMNAQLFFCDFKGVDGKDFINCARYWNFNDCEKGLNEFYSVFTDRLNNAELVTNYCVLVFDEWAGFIQSMDKKSAEAMKARLSTILMMGRGVKMHVVIGLQRADSTLFPLGGRDNFTSIIALGNLSKEQKSMLFSGYDLSDDNRQGQGYWLRDGEQPPLTRIIVPSRKDLPSLIAGRNSVIVNALTR